MFYLVKTSFFLRTVIKEAHANVSDNDVAACKVRPHDIRVAATSLAFRKNRSLQSILYCTYWKCKSVFAMHYLKEVEMEFAYCSTLGGLLVTGLVLGAG